MLEWDTAAFGCIDRGTFRLDPAPRTALSTVGGGRFYSKTADRRAPITAHWQTYQTFAQQKALWQWYYNDLFGGALPFQITLWLWDRERTVRAHHISNLTTRFEEYDYRLTAGTFEIERESIQPPAEFSEPPPDRDPQCVPLRAAYLTGARP